MASKRGRVIVVGSSNTDLVVQCAHLPRPGETVLGNDLHTFGGGKGANQAVAAARLGAEVVFIGAFGDDAFGKARRAELQAEGIDCSRCAIRKGIPSGVALISIGMGTDQQKAENQIVVAPGANMRLTPDEISTMLPELNDRDVILCSLEIPLDAVRKALLQAEQAGATRILNPAPFPAKGWPQDWRYCADVLTPNESEFERLIGDCVGSSKARQTLWEQLNPKSREAPLAHCWLVTRGAKGVLRYEFSEEGRRAYLNGERFGKEVERKYLLAEAIPVKPVEPVDTVGAGDCFNGALAASLSALDPYVRRTKLSGAAAFAGHAAALKVTRHGAQAGMPHLDEVKKFSMNK